MNKTKEEGRIAPGVLVGNRTAEILQRHEQLIDQVTRHVVIAATEALDAEMLVNFRVNTKRSPGPCGDQLAGKLHKIIEAAIHEQLAF
jgi:hypothetical protein